MEGYSILKLRQGSELTGLPGLPTEALLQGQMVCGREWYYKEKNYESIILNLTRQYGGSGGEILYHCILEKVEL